MKANIMCKVIEMTKVEAKKAGIVGTAEFDQLKELREAYPTFRIEVKASKSKSTMKGLTIPYMKKYIEAHDDAEKTNMTMKPSRQPKPREEELKMCLSELDMMVESI